MSRLASQFVAIALALIPAISLAQSWDSRSAGNQRQPYYDLTSATSFQEELPDVPPPLDAGDAGLPMAPPAASSADVGDDWMLQGSSDSSGSCDTCCDSGCDFDLAFIAPSDCAFKDFVSPMTNPVYFEDPRTLSELRFIFVNHSIPNDNIRGGGTIQAYAMQFRIALTERLSIIAVKDGWVDMNPNLAAFDSSGFANITAGLKYNLIRDPKNQTIVSAGATFEIPSGQSRVFQGLGDGDFNIFLTGGKQLGCDWHALSSIGLRVPANHTDGSQMAWISSHLDRRL
ncbi:MAG: hypothetical protein N2C14_23390, partial [Planctomycetales bacterium]